MLPPVIKTITVPCPPELTFSLFTTEIGLWWPLDKHSCAAMEGETAQSLSVDCRNGGEFWETDHNGKRILWGSFTAFEPPARLSIAWHIARPPSEATDVTVTFKPDGTGTKVTLTHSNWEVFGDSAQAMRNGYDNGWVHVFETRFKDVCLREPLEG